MRRSTLPTTLLESVLVQIRDELREHGKKLDGLRSGQEELHVSVRGLRGDLRALAADTKAVESEVGPHEKLEGR